VKALQGASFRLAAGEVHALMGENGAGKSTLAKVIAGVVRRDEGEITIRDQQAAINGPLDAQRLGIAIIHQELDLFPNLSVAENIVVANQEFTEHGFARRKAMQEFAAPFLQQVGLGVSPKRRVSSLNIGQMQLVMIARALSMRARVLLMDEPTSSLFHDSVEQLFKLIENLKLQGVSIVYVSHKMDEVFRICDRMTVMRDGTTVGTRRKGESSGEELIGMMVGRPWKARERIERKAQGAPLLEVSHLKTRKLNDISFQLKSGEVLGIAGLVGAGRSELGEALMGLDSWHSGQMTIAGRTVIPNSIDVAHRNGLRLLAEDRKLDGLMMQMSVLENSTIADLPKFASAGFVNGAQEQTQLEPLFRKLSLKTSSLHAPVSSLSGGGQQKVLFARCLLGKPEILFLDDPTRGIDVGAKEDIYQLIEELAEQGKGVLFVSSELPELLRCCDRILVLREGILTATLDASQTNQEEIMTYATRASSPAGEKRWQN
jgi:ABC-type sugar transport system ATPase subunit